MNYWKFLLKKSITFFAFYGIVTIDVYPTELLSSLEKDKELKIADKEITSVENIKTEENRNVPIEKLDKKDNNNTINNSSKKEEQQNVNDSKQTSCVINPRPIFDEQTTITSDRLEVINDAKQNRFIFTDKVEINSKDLKILADKMTVLANKDQKSDNQTMGTIRKIVAQSTKNGSKVTIIQPDRTTFAGKVTVFAESGKMILDDHPVVFNKNGGEVKGKQIILYNKGEHAVIIGSDQDRPKVTLRSSKAENCHENTANSNDNLNNDVTSKKTQENQLPSKKDEKSQEIKISTDKSAEKKDSQENIPEPKLVDSKTQIDKTNDLQPSIDSKTKTQSENLAK